MKPKSKKPSYRELQLDVKMYKKQIKQLLEHIENKDTCVEVYRQQSIETQFKYMEEKKKAKQLSELNSTLSDNRTHFQCERAELATALIEISNCKELEIAQEVARIALKQVNTVLKLKDKNPF